MRALAGFCGAFKGVHGSFALLRMTAGYWLGVTDSLRQAD